MGRRCASDNSLGRSDLRAGTIASFDASGVDSAISRLSVTKAPVMRVKHVHYPCFSFRASQEMPVTIILRSPYRRPFLLVGLFLCLQLTDWRTNCGVVALTPYQPSGSSSRSRPAVCEIRVSTTQYASCPATCSRVSRDVITDGCPHYASRVDNGVQISKKKHLGQRISRIRCPLQRDGGYAGIDPK